MQSMNVHAPTLTTSSCPVVPSRTCCSCHTKSCGACIARFVSTEYLANLTFEHFLACTSHYYLPKSSLFLDIERLRACQSLEVAYQMLTCSAIPSICTICSRRSIGTIRTLAWQPSLRFRFSARCPSSHIQMAFELAITFSWHAIKSTVLFQKIKLSTHQVALTGARALTFTMTVSSDSSRSAFRAVKALFLLFWAASSFCSLAA